MDPSKSYAVFEGKFPDDSEEQGGEIIVPAGRNILETIRGRLAHHGVNADAPRQHSFYGWASEFSLGKVRICLLLQQPGPWL